MKAHSDELESPPAVNPADVRTMLEERGITEALISEAVAQGRQVKDSLRPNQTTLGGNVAPFDQIVCSIRDQAQAPSQPIKWHKGRIGQTEVTRSEDSAVDLWVASGDEHTGLEGLVAATRSPKGTSSKRMVEEHLEEQLDFFRGHDTEGDVVRLQPAQPLLVMLLVAFKAEDSRWEISMPERLDSKGRAVAGRPIMTGVVPRDQPAVLKAGIDDEPEIEVPIKPKPTWGS